MSSAQSSNFGHAIVGSRRMVDVHDNDIVQLVDRDHNPVGVAQLAVQINNWELLPFKLLKNHSFYSKVDPDVMTSDNTEFIMAFEVTDMISNIIKEGVIILPAHMSEFLQEATQFVDDAKQQKTVPENDDFIHLLIASNEIIVKTKLFADILKPDQVDNPVSMRMAEELSYPANIIANYLGSKGWKVHPLIGMLNAIHHKINLDSNKQEPAAEPKCDCGAHNPVPSDKMIIDPLDFASKYAHPDTYFDYVKEAFPTIHPILASARVFTAMDVVLSAESPTTVEEAKKIATDVLDSLNGRYDDEEETNILAHGIILSVKYNDKIKALIEADEPQPTLH